MRRRPRQVDNHALSYLWRRDSAHNSSPRQRVVDAVRTLLTMAVVLVAITSLMLTANAGSKAAIVTLFVLLVGALYDIVAGKRSR